MSLPSTMKSDESPSSSADMFALPKKTLSTSKSMEPFDSKYVRPSSYVLQPVVSDARATNAVSRSRFTTNNLNCCKSCSQASDVDARNVRRVETVTMPKLQPTNGNRPATDVKYKKPDGKKSSIPSVVPSGESVNATNTIFRKMSLRKPSDIENRFVDRDFRRQSLDESATNGKPIAKQLSSIDHLRHIDPQRMQSYSTIGDQRKFSSMLSNNYKKQIMTDDHLKSLESKIRKHKIEAMRNVKEYTFNSTQSKPAPTSNGVNSKLDQFTSSKKRLKEHADRMFQTMGSDSVLHNNSKSVQSRIGAIGAHNYGVISATELYKLRTPTESII